MFHNEHDVLAIKREESARWIDELHVCEADRTFKVGPREPILPPSDDFLKTHVFPAGETFDPGFNWRLQKRPPFVRKFYRARRNETLQRNYVHEVLSDVAAEDIVILSDLDEVIDARQADEIVDAARRHGVVSIRLHHTMFYLNLYSTNWHEVWKVPSVDYSHRVFVMTGERFNQLGREEKSDRMRMLGKVGKQIGKIHLMDGMRGFHHSWLGDAQSALDKLNSYAHALRDHTGELTDENGQVTQETMERFIQSGRSIFPGNNLEIRSFEEIEPLQTVTENRDRFEHLILRP
jgi:hypothetical protein